MSYQLTPEHVVDIVAGGGWQIARAMHDHDVIGAILKKQTANIPSERQVRAYYNWLDLTQRYVDLGTVPMLEGSSKILKAMKNDSVAKATGSFLYHESTEEKTKDGKSHGIWAEQGKNALGLESVFGEKYPDAIQEYVDFFVTNAKDHPYAAFGAKLVLENLAIMTSAKFRAGLLESGIPNIEKSLTFIEAHGELDEEHTKEANHFIINKFKKNPQALHEIVMGKDATVKMYLPPDGLLNYI